MWSPGYPDPINEYVAIALGLSPDTIAACLPATAVPSIVATLVAEIPPEDLIGMGFVRTSGVGSVRESMPSEEGPSATGEDLRSALMRHCRVDESPRPADSQTYVPGMRY